MVAGACFPRPIIPMKPFCCGKVFGVPLWLHPARLALCPLLAVPCAIRDPMAAVALVFVMVSSILAHEIGHALAAQSAGLHVRAIHHRGWSGTCVFEDPGRRTMIRCRVLVAGPLVNLLIAAALLPVALLLPDRWHATFIVGAAATLNLLMGGCSLLPILPLDGGHILLALLCSRWPERRATMMTAAIGMVVSIPAALVAPVLLVSGFPLGAFAHWSLNWTTFRRTWRGDGSHDLPFRVPIPERSVQVEADRLMAPILSEQSRRNAERRRRAQAS